MWLAYISLFKLYLFQLSSRHTTGEVDVWFVLLEKPDITHVGPVMKPRPQQMMADAYKVLHEVTNKHNLSLKLDLAPNKKLVSTA